MVTHLTAAPSFRICPTTDCHVIVERDAGNGGAVRELRRLHLTGMAASLVQLAAVIGMVPAVV
jgi:hypothetical protein